VVEYDIYRFKGKDSDRLVAEIWMSNFEMGFSPPEDVVLLTSKLAKEIYEAQGEGNIFPEEVVHDLRELMPS